jgi:hypothetical protein
MDDERFYLRVAEELRQGQVRAGLWVKALALASGDNHAARSVYIRLRAEQLIHESTKEQSQRRLESIRIISRGIATTVVRILVFVTAFAAALLGILCLGLAPGGGMSNDDQAGLVVVGLGCLAVSVTGFYWLVRVTRRRDVSSEQASLSIPRIHDK